MDAVKFIKERDRMCDSLFGCEGCPANSQENGFGICYVATKSQYTPEQQIEIVEKWSNEHPRKTRQRVFLEKYPNARVNTKGTVDIWPCAVEKDMSNVRHCNSLSCSDCRQEFWLQEVE